MENQQMAMPAEMAAAGPNPDEMAIYEQMRQEISPQEFSNEMLASASQVDPQAVAEFTQELQGLDMPPEVLDALNDVVDEILANPERYAELRAQYMEQGLPEDILPEQFDPQFFTALNMAIDQMIAAPTGVQAFAQGGIAELKPIAKAIASYGRNGDTMLAHITPAEARMLRRRGGSGTVNPDTGLPEFFIKKLFKGVGKALKSVGNAVKKFASSTVGRLVTTVALGFFLGPAAASFMGVGSAAGVAAVSGFVGGAGSTLLAGGNLKDALKAGAIGGLTAGAGAGIMGGADAFAAGSYTGPTTVGGQFDKFKSAITPNAAPTGNLAPVVDAPAPVPGTGAQGIGPNQMPVPDADPMGRFIQQNEAARAAASAPAAIPGASVDATAAQGPLAKTPTYQTPTVGESFSKMGEGLGMGDAPASFDTFKQGATDLFSPGPTNAQVTARAREIMSTTPGASLKDAMSVAAKELSPGILRTYGPAAVAGLGTMAAFGGFDTKPVQGGEITNSLMKSADQRIREKGTQRQMYMQGLPGVVYDDFGAPVFGQSTRLPTYDVPDYNSGGFDMSGQGIMNLPTAYTPPPTYTSPSGSMGSRSVAQPYNTSNMYSNIMPQRYADGGTVTDLYRTVLRREPSPGEIDNWKGQFGDTIDERERAVFREAAGAELAAQRTSREAEEVKQKAARDAVAQQKAMRRAAGSGQMYANINAGISALAPETNPMNTADTGFGARNREAQLASLQQTYGPMLQGQRNAMNRQSTILGQPEQERPITTMPVMPPVGAPMEGGPTTPVGVGDQAGVQNPIYQGGRSQEGGGGGLEVDRSIGDFPSPLQRQMVQDQYARVGRTGFGDQANQIDAPGFAHWLGQLQSGQIRPEDLPGRFDTAVQDYMRERPDDRYTQYIRQFQQGQQPRLLNMGGIAGLAQGGYPRRNGQISGPGTEKSDSIPAMLSDGEFVMTAKAVRGAGKGSRRAGAKQMYKLMHQLEKNAERG